MELFFFLLAFVYIGSIENPCNRRSSVLSKGLTCIKYQLIWANCAAALQSPEPPKHQLPGGCLACLLDNQHEGFCIAAGGPPWDPKRRFSPRRCLFLSRTLVETLIDSDGLVTIAMHGSAISFSSRYPTVLKHIAIFLQTGHCIKKDLKCGFCPGLGENYTFKCWAAYLLTFIVLVVTVLDR